MTYEEALETKLRMCDICRNEAKPTKASCENCSDRVAIVAISKQIPRKPRYEDGDYYCKECGTKLETYLYSRCVSYCSSCGSAHDWDDCK